MAYTIISQNNTTTTLADENGNVITVPSRSILDAGTTFTLVKINNNTATLEDSNGKVYRDIPCCIDLTQVTGFNVTKVNNNKATLEDGDGKVYAGVPCIVNLTGTGGGSAVIEELNVTPSTSAQTITASGGTDGYSPVNVSAVDASIDANITAGNIKDGVTILGVTGNVVELNGETKTVTPQVYGQTLYPTAPKNGITEITVNAVTHNIDANIQAGNIKKDVEILGVTGTYEGQTPTGTKSITANGVYDVTNYASADVQVPTTAPAHYIEKTVDANGKLQTSTNIINLNGVTDVGNYVLVSAYKEISFPSNTSVDLSGLTTMSGNYACQQMFQSCTGITSVDLSGLTTMSGNYACQQMFQSCTGITSVDLASLSAISGGSTCNYMFSGCSGLTSINLSNLTTISGYSGGTRMFENCTGITSVDLSSLTTISNSYSCSYMFYGCSGITSVNLSGLTTISGSNACNQMFQNCTGLTSIDLSGLTTISGNNGCDYMFLSCTGLTSADLSGLTTLSGSFACQNMFGGCISLATVYIGGTTEINFGTYTNQFNNMFRNCTQNIDVYAPAANQTAIEAFSGYPNFGGTGTVTWHWRS